MRRSKSSPPRYVSPPVAMTSKTLAPMSRIETSNVPPPRSKTTTLRSHLPPEAVRERRARRLVDDAEHVEAGDASRVLRRLALAVVEVRGDRDDGAPHRPAEERLRVGLQLGEHQRGELRDGHDAAAQLDADVVASGPGTSAYGRILRASSTSCDPQRRPMSRFAAKTVFSGFVIAWRFASAPTRRSPFFATATIDGVSGCPRPARDDARHPVLHGGDDRVRRAEVDADDGLEIAHPRKLQRSFLSRSFAEVEPRLELERPLQRASRLLPRALRVEHDARAPRARCAARGPARTAASASARAAGDVARRERGARPRRGSAHVARLGLERLAVRGERGPRAPGELRRGALLDEPLRALRAGPACAPRGRARAALGMLRIDPERELQVVRRLSEPPLRHRLLRPRDELLDSRGAPDDAGSGARAAPGAPRCDARPRSAAPRAGRASRAGAVSRA